MKLYHYTDLSHLGGILKSNEILPVPACLDTMSLITGKGRQVVWLTSEDRWDFEWAGSRRDVRFEIDLESKSAIKPSRWVDWFVKNGGDERLRPGFVEKGGGQAAADCWWVYEGSILLSQVDRMTCRTKLIRQGVARFCKKSQLSITV